MSEHIVVSGNVEYIHMPYRKDGFSWCRHCKQYASKLDIYFDEGGISSSMLIKCGKCKKSIYVVEISERKYTRDNIKCTNCGKKIAYEDAYSVVYRAFERKRRLYCSKRCEKEDDKKWVKN